ncbi:hypothetical protein PIB30_079700 [Stylosanthes scabra]|uniref:Uncharacterized protein n=1 Tax=Stylosanthes scabra TaxID=79078 RepID=A0ABU6SRM3_9FABA|nr:hypothetical protein [Stylosanthes scabra]
MAMKYYNVVTLWMAMMVLVIVAANADGNDVKAQQDRCNKYCYNACAFPSKFCKWWCGSRCQNPIGFDSYRLDSANDEGKGYPVPTEEDYRSYTKNNH